MNRFRPAALLVSFCLLAIPSSFAQTRRIAGPIDYYRTAALPGHRSPLARPEFDRGPVAPAFALRGLTLTVRRTPHQQADLNRLLAALQNPTSPQFHKWLTPEQFADRFGATPADLATLRQWLEGYGFQIRAVARSRTFIRFDGNAAQVRPAFGADIHRYLLNGVEHYANTGDPSLPANVAPLVLAVGGLHDFGPHPHHVKIPRGKPATAPQYRDGQGGNDLAPGDLGTIYNFNSLEPLGKANGGSGQTVVVIDASDVTQSDLDLYRTTFSQGARALQVVHPDADPGIVSSPDDWATEATMDLEIVSGVVAKAQLVLEADANVWNGIADAVDNARGQVISMSFGICESDVDPGDAAGYEAVAQEANAQGITMIASSGDAGGAACDTGLIAAGATQGFAVNLPASLPEVTAVGGTTLDDGSGSYWNSSNDSYGGSAKSYIPEVVWNDSIGALTPQVFAASGGGASTLFTKPDWQTGSGVPADGYRDVPDVALAASAQHDGYVIAMGGVLSTAAGSPYTVGGTSASAPLFAGIVALVNAMVYDDSSGNINPILYTIAAGGSGASVFHDITSGDNRVICAAGSPGCASSPLNYYGYYAGVGYDQATGLGSVDTDQLDQAWASYTTAPGITSLSPAAAFAGTSSPVSVDVLGSRFQNGDSVIWTFHGATTTLSSTYTDATSLSFTVPSNLLTTAGTAYVQVVNPSGLYSSPATFAIQGPTATISSLTPPSAIAGGSAFTLTVNGAGFLSGAQIVWNSTPLTTTFVSASQLTAPIGAALIASNGSASVTVVNGDTSTSAPGTFSIIPTPSATISSLSPASVTAGGGNFTLTVNGRGFAKGATVMWNGAPVTTTFVSATKLTGAVTKAMIATPANVLVKVVNADSTSSLTSNYTVNPAPGTIASLSPSSAVAGDVGFTLTLTGTNYYNGSIVMWGATALTTTYVNATCLRAAVTTAQIAAAGTVNVSVKNPGGAVSAVRSFTINKPTISALSATSAVAGSAPFNLTVTGTNFLSTSTVVWGSTPLTTTYGSATSLTAAVTSTQLTPAGNVNITVKNSSSTSSSSYSFAVNAPAISSLSATSAVAGSDPFSLGVTGTGFLSGSTVMWGSTALATTYNSATSLSAAVTSTQLAAAGSVNLTVKNTSSASSAAYKFTVSAPTAGSLSPSSAVAGSAPFNLAVTGSGFLSGSTVMWGSTALATTYNSATSLTAAVTSTQLATAGSVNVTVKNTSSASSAAYKFTVSAPAIGSLSPTSAVAGSAAFNLAVTGTGFLSGSTVMWGSTALVTTYNSATSLTAAVTGTQLANAGSVNVTVKNTSSASSAAAKFTVAVPSIGSLSPSSVVAGAAAFNLAVTGTGFISGSTVMWGSTALTTTYNSATSLTAAVTSAQLVSAGTVSVTVKNTSNGSSGASKFTVSTPAIASLSPSSAAAGAAGFTLAVTGSGFISGSTVMWGATALTTTYNSATSLSATVTGTQVASAASVSVTVKNTGSASSPAFKFAVNAPTISSLSPSSVAAGSAGFTLTVNGANFVSGATVMWGTTALTTTYLNASSVTAPITSAQIASSGTVKVTVKNATTAISSAATFTINAPKITSLSPATIPAGSTGFTLTVNGSNFLSGATVVWGTASLPTSFVSATQLTATVLTAQVADAGADAVYVANPGGAPSATSSFSVTAAPVLISLSQTSANSGDPGFQMTVTGRNFVSGSVVMWGSTALPTTFTNGTSLTATVDQSLLASSGSAIVTVVLPQGATTSGITFTVN